MPVDIVAAGWYTKAYALIMRHGCAWTCARADATCRSPHASRHYAILLVHAAFTACGLNSCCKYPVSTAPLKHSLSSKAAHASSHTPQPCCRAAVQSLECGEPHESGWRGGIREEGKGAGGRQRAAVNSSAWQPPRKGRFSVDGCGIVSHPINIFALTLGDGPG